MPDRPRYTVARYIVDRLIELRVRHIFQVPGNYTAQFLIEAQNSGKLECVGTTNEQEAGYAADAYARLHGLGVVCTTYGVGSLSAMNAIAGARVELCPVVLINGGPKQSKTANLENHGIKFAHAIDTIRTDEKFFREISAATAVITDPEDAPDQIDRVLRACLTQRMPVYLESRDGVWDMPCRKPAGPLPEKPRQPVPPAAGTEAVVKESVAAAVAAVLTRLQAAKHPVLWGGEELQRLGLEARFEEIIKLTGLKYSTTLMGKSLVPETAPGDPTRRRDEFIGVYDSAFAPGDVAEVLEKSACVLALGPILSDFYEKIVVNTHSTGSMVLAAAGAVRVGHAIYPNVPLDLFVAGLIDGLKKKGRAGDHTPPEGFDKLSPSRFAASGAESLAASAPPAAGMSWADASGRIQKHVGAKAYVLADTSLTLFPAAELVIPSRNHFLAQTCWLSIGYTVGAAVGLSTLMKKDERALVLVGDGGFQMGPQGLATLARLKKPVTVVVLDNALYAVEQFLVVTQIVPDQLDYYKAGSTREAIFFNRLEIDAKADQRWNYVALAKAFGCIGVEVRTPADLDKALADAKKVTDRPTLIAARIDSRGVPPELQAAVGQVPAAAELGAEARAARPRARFNALAFN